MGTKSTTAIEEKEQEKVKNIHLRGWEEKNLYYFYNLLQYDEHFLIVGLVSKERTQVEKFQLNDSFI